MKAIILTGLPCSGKSTIGNIIMNAMGSEDRYSLISPDSILETLQEHIETYTNFPCYVSYNDLYERGWFEMAKKLSMDYHLRDMASRGSSVIVDDVYLSQKSRKEIKKKLQEYQYTCIYNVFVNTDFETCVLRDKYRCSQSGKCIPSSEFTRMEGELEPPTENEFDTGKGWTISDYSVTHPSGNLQNLIEELRKECL